MPFYPCSKSFDEGDFGCLDKCRYLITYGKVHAVHTGSGNHARDLILAGLNDHLANHITALDLDDLAKQLVTTGKLHDD